MGLMPGPEQDAGWERQGPSWKTNARENILFAIVSRGHRYRKVINLINSNHCVLNCLDQ